MQIPRDFLESVAYRIRKSVVTIPTEAGSGHPTTCLSAVDITTVLFWAIMRYDPQNFNNSNADRFILSKGHASALLYAIWHELGVISADELKTYRTFNSVLEGHPTFRFSRTEAATGSLGIGLSIGVGEALVAKQEKRDFTVYVLMGDAEIAEGSVWEAAELAAYYKLNNLVAIVDCNRLGQSTESLVDSDLERYARRFDAFGFKPYIIDGHNMSEIYNTLKNRTYDGPVVILARTRKGYGVDFAEDKEGFHGVAFSKEQLAQAYASLEKRFPAAAQYTGNFKWQPTLPPAEKQIASNKPSSNHLTIPEYKVGQSVATRVAFGEALVALGLQHDDIVVLDADVQNSTMTQQFGKQFPERFVQCFIAEQNMISVAVGMQRRGKVPYAATFGAFFTRAHDQIRMAAIGNAALRLVGSHAGISIGQDGPSQMALEDIALMRGLSDSVVLYPSDAVSASKLTVLMHSYKKGISYLRTTRMATPVLYGVSTPFNIGGCAVLREYPDATACIIGAGVTLHEALKAHDLLAKQGVKISVIDLYSVKPLDRDTIIRVATASNKRIITVEDHYHAGGIGETVAATVADTGIHVKMLAVPGLPRSGSPAELLAWAGIDAEGIIKEVKKQ
jgi:transketolase